MAEDTQTDVEAALARLERNVYTHTALETPGAKRALDFAIVRARLAAQEATLGALASAVQSGWTDESIDQDLYQNDALYHAIVYTVRRSLYSGDEAWLPKEIAEIVGSETEPQWQRTAQRLLDSGDGA